MPSNSVLYEKIYNRRFEDAKLCCEANQYNLKHEYPQFSHLSKEKRIIAIAHFKALIGFEYEIRYYSTNFREYAKLRIQRELQFLYKRY